MEQRQIDQSEQGKRPGVCELASQGKSTAWRPSQPTLVTASLKSAPRFLRRSRTCAAGGVIAGRSPVGRSRHEALTAEVPAGYRGTGAPASTIAPLKAVLGGRIPPMGSAMPLARKQYTYPRTHGLHFNIRLGQHRHASARLTADGVLSGWALSAVSLAPETMLAKPAPLQPRTYQGKAKALRPLPTDTDLQGPRKEAADDESKWARCGCAIL